MKHCSHCNQPVHTKTKICPECGRSLKRGANEAPEQTPPSQMPNNPQTQQMKKMHRAALPMFLIFLVLFAAAGIIIVTVLQNIAKSKHRAGVSHEKPVYTVPPTEGTIYNDGTSDSEGEQANEVKYLDSELKKDVFGQDVLIVHLEYSNKGDSNSSFMKKYRAQLFQDGVSRLETLTDAGEDTGIISEVQPGASAKITVSFEVDPEKPMQIVVSDYSQKNTYLDMTLTPAVTERAEGL